MSRLDVTELEESDYDRYDALVNESPHGSVWSLASFALHRRQRTSVLGVFKGRELVGGGAFPVAGRAMVRHVHEVPWSGLVGRSRSEGENQAIARHVARYCRDRFDEATLSFSPEWTDIREFTWLGYRPHIRYTYRGWGAPYERRLRLRPVAIKRGSLGFGRWTERTYRTGDSEITGIFDNRHGYYWKANEGGTYHAELVNAFIQDVRACGLRFDLVGANSPQRGLFKRAFGGELCPYYTMTTTDVSDLREAVPIYESVAAVL